MYHLGTKNYSTNPSSFRYLSISLSRTVDNALGIATEQHTMRSDTSHCATFIKVVNHVENKGKNTTPEISLVEYLCFVCEGTNLSLEKRGKIPISLIHNSFSYHCTPNVVFANGFDLKRLGLRKSGVKFCFALWWIFSKTRTGNRTKELKISTFHKP